MLTFNFIVLFTEKLLSNLFTIKCYQLHMQINNSYTHLAIYHIWKMLFKSYFNKSKTIIKINYYLKLFLLYRHIIFVYIYWVCVIFCYVCIMCNEHVRAFRWPIPLSNYHFYVLRTFQIVTLTTLQYRIHSC